MNEKKVTSFKKIIEAFKQLDSNEWKVLDFEKINLEYKLDYNTLEMFKGFVNEYPEYPLLEKIKELNSDQLQELDDLFKKEEAKKQRELEIQSSIEESEKFNKKIMDILIDKWGK